MPEPVKNLFRVTELKLKAAQLGISKVDLGPKGGKIEFMQSTLVPAQAVIDLVQKQSHRYRFASANQLAIVATIEDREKRFKHIEDLLEHFTQAA